MNELKEKREKMGMVIVEEVINWFNKDYVVNPENMKARILDELLYKIY